LSADFLLRSLKLKETGTAIKDLPWEAGLTIVNEEGITSARTEKHT